MIKFILLLTLSINSYSYDFKIKDNRGRTTGYLDRDDDKVYIIDVRGRRHGYIEEDEIKDNYGDTEYYIEED